MTGIDNQTRETIVSKSGPDGLPGGDLGAIFASNAQHVFDLVDQVTNHRSDFVSSITHDAAGADDNESDPAPETAGTISDIADSIPDLAGVNSGADDGPGGDLGAIFASNAQHVFDLIDQVTNHWDDFASGITDDAARIADHVSDATSEVAGTVPDIVDSVPDLVGVSSGPDGLLGGALGDLGKLFDGPDGHSTPHT